MRLFEELPRRLTEFVNPHFNHRLLTVVNLAPIDAAFIGVGMENIVCFFGILGAAKYQINPLVEVVGDVGALQRAPVLL